MLAQAFLKKAPKDWTLIEVDIDELDLTHKQDTQALVRDVRPELVINCAAYTQVDACETDQARAFAVNGSGVGYLAEAARNVGAKVLHFSTDYVFDGTSQNPYLEGDEQAPINVYGASKQEGERQLQKYLEDYLLIRTQWLYGQGGKNFVHTLLDLAEKSPWIKVVADQTGSPTWTEDLAEASLGLVQKKTSGTFHLVNQGVCSWYQFACRIMLEAGLSVKIQPCRSADFPRRAKRPTKAVLSTRKAEAVLGRPLPDWKMSLGRYWASLAKASASSDEGGGGLL